MKTYSVVFIDYFTRQATENICITDRTVYEIIEWFEKHQGAKCVNVREVENGTWGEIIVRI